jgi:hypothetical protein
VEEQPAAAAVERLHHARERVLLRRGQRGLPRSRANSLDRRPPAPLGVLDRDEAARLERAQRRMPAAGRTRGLGHGERRLRQGEQRGALAVAEPLLAGERSASRFGDRRHQRAADPHPWRPAGARAGRQDEREPARGRGAVLVGDPQPEPH